MNNSQKIIKALNTELKQLTPVQWAEQNRVLTSDITPFPGKMSYNRTPYLREIANSIMDDNPAQIITVMKGAQIGFSIGGIFTDIGWIISQNPGNILFMAGDDDLVKKAMTGPIDQMINSSGLQHLIRASNVRAGRNQKTGDTIKGKEFPGGSLTAWSGQNLKKLRQISMRFGFIDDFDMFKVADKSSGDVVSLIEQRFAAYGYTRKIFYISTPEIKQTSNIEPMYLKGDQRRFMMPCPICGEYIPFEWQLDIEELEIKAGVYFERDNIGNLITKSVGYVCQSCGGFFDESHKFKMLTNGKWFPTAKAFSNEYISYHISALYAPPGMYNWTYYAQKWCEIHPKIGNIKIEKLKTFVNTCLGQTWEERGRSIEITKLAKNTRNYEINTVPNALSIQDGNGKIVILTCAVDLNGKTDDARIDYEVVAWSETGSSYSIDHGSIGTFQRSTTIRMAASEKQLEKEQERIKWTYRTKQQNNVWDEFEKTIMAKIYESDDKLRRYNIVMFGIDTGHFTVHAYTFSDKHQNCISLKGKVDNKFTPHDSIKAFYTKSEKVPGLHLVEGNRVKDHLADNISLMWDEDMNIDQPPGFMNFPAPANEKYLMKTYFKEYEGEKREPQMNPSGTAIGFRWVKHHSSSLNHFWDCRLYAIVVKNIFTDMFCKAAKVPANWNNLVQILKK